MADDRDALLREVDEELRRDQMQKAWERYNGLILGGALAIIVGVGGYKFVQGRKIAAAEAAGAEYAAALQLTNDKKSEEADKALNKIISGGSSGYAALGRLQLAGSQMRAGKAADALATFEALGKDGSADDLLKSFAQLQAASLRMGEADFTEIQNRLTQLASDSSPFKVSARELLGLAAFKAGNVAEARKYLEPLLIDPTASRQIQDRIKVVMARIAEAETGKPADAVKPDDKKAEEKKPEAAAPAPSAAEAPKTEKKKADEKKPEATTDVKPAVKPAETKPEPKADQK